MTDTATRSKSRVEKPKTALYVHVPFCVHKCGYCDFNSWAEEGVSAQLAWLDGIRMQMELWGERLSGWEIDTIFWGGGTPSLLRDDILKTSFELLNKNFNLSKGYEWTLECNPETLTKEKLSTLEQGGVNRISLGIQSFDDEYLRRLERRARRKDNERALELVNSFWSGRWSLDLMFGLPGQTLEKSKDDLNIALAYGMKHLSAYQLTLTTQRSKAWSQPPEQALLEMFDQTEELLSSHGLERYEVSNFSKPGEECRHNLRYWNLESFVGIGPGAAGLLPNSILADEASQFGAHQRQPESFDKWIELAKNNSLGTLTPRTPIEHLEELLMMGLRLKKGVWEGRFGKFPLPLEDFFGKQLRGGLIQKNNENYIVTPRGLRILDTILLDLFEELKKVEAQNLDLGYIDPTFK